MAGFHILHRYAYVVITANADPVVIFEEAEILANDPEISQPAHLLQAMALLRLDRTEEASVLAKDALHQLRTRGREHYEYFIWVPVAEWVYGKTLETSGDSLQAREHFARAAQIAPNAWFAE